MRAFYGTDSTGKKILVVTNLDESGKRIGGKVRTSSVSPLSLPSVKTIYWKTPPASNSTPTSTKGSQEPSDKEGGVLNCFWKGQVVSPVLVGDKLVCPSEKTPLSNDQKIR